MELSPQQACVVRGNHEEIVPATEISPGEMLIVRPGEKIPLDGEVLDGVSAVDQAHLTGESIPVEKKSGDTVFAGSLNGRGSLSIRSTHRYEETTLARIIQLIEAAEHKRAPIQRFIDTFARVYTPAVLGLALLIAVLPPLLLHAEWMVWIYRALVLLVIACPCALVISTPVTLVSALTRGARHGVLIKGGKDLEVLSRTRAVAFDKTGTLTNGLLRVTDILPLDHTSPDTLLQTVAALEHRSEHVLADGLVAEARSRGLTYESVRVTRFESLPGRGVAADVDGTTYFLGNRELCQEHQFCTPDVTKILDTCEAEGKTTVVLGVRGKALGVIALQDRLRPRTSFVMDALRKSGIQRTVILSGDHETAVARVGREAGIDAWESGLLPDQKVQRIETLQHQWGIVAMVGDGINDAPALASASVGIAMGGAGSDTALESADVVLMSDSLEKLPFVFDLSKNAVRIIRQNIAIALGLKLLFFVLALTGTSTLWMAILADDGAALLVILNGLRMLGFGKEKD
jgi:Cd2+/Zn2+-exporting ATPase